MTRIGAEMLARRGEDQRLITQRPAARRRREMDAEYHAAKAAQAEAANYPMIALEGLGDDEDD